MGNKGSDLMKVLIVGSADIKKGVEYSGIVPRGNAFMMTEKVRISVNRAPFAYLPVFTDIYTLTDFTYSSEKDTSILFTRIVEDNFTILYTNSCPSNVILLADTESNSICEVTVGDDTLTVNITIGAYIDHGNNQDITMRIYAGATLLDTVTKSYRRNKKDNFVHTFAIASQIDADTVVSFTLEADGSDAEVFGLEQSSIIQIEKLT